MENLDIFTKLLCCWMKRLLELYKYHKQIKQFIMDDNLLTGCNEKIRNVIFEYIKDERVYFQTKLSDWQLNDEANDSFVGADDRDIVVFPVYHAVYNMIEEFLIENKLDDELKDNMYYEPIMIFMFNLLNEFWGEYEVRPRIYDHLMLYPSYKYDIYKLEVFGYTDYSLLVCGFMREFISNNFINIHFPFSLWILIYDFYPNYDVYIFDNEKQQLK